MAEASQETFRILLAGDFTGRGWQPATNPVAGPQFIDRDNFDSVLASMNVHVDLDSTRLSFRELEDFHPDRIYSAAQLGRATPPPPPAEKAAPMAKSGADLLDQMMTQSDRDRPKPVTVEDANDLAAFIKRATAGQTVRRPSSEEKRRESQRQDAGSVALRTILHDPRFQALESAWRALWMLATGLEPGSELKLYLLDASLPEMIVNLDSIAARLRGVGQWGCIAAAYDFGQSAVHVQVLRRLAAFGRALKAPVLAGADTPEGSDTPEWNEFRRSPDAKWVGLALPRFLLRLPYGRDTSPIESFPFDEMPESEHNAYLWGHPAFFCAYLIGQSFLTYGWQLAGRLHQRVDGLPLHVYREDGEMVAKPCAEVLLSEREAGVLLESGYMPIASLKGQDSAMVVRFQSVANPPSRLAGLGSSGTIAVA
jgi:type VI secretion system protein ImpC